MKCDNGKETLEPVYKALRQQTCKKKIECTEKETKHKVSMDDDRGSGLRQMGE